MIFMEIGVLSYYIVEQIVGRVSEIKIAFVNGHFRGSYV